MNERIKQLAQEAGMYVDLNGNPWPKWMSAEECELAYKKFAVLIVKECLNIVEKNESDIHYDNGMYSVYPTVCEIKEHFGVE